MDKSTILAMEAGEELDRLVSIRIFGYLIVLPYSTDISAAWQVVEKLRTKWNITIITGSLKMGRVVMHPWNKFEPLVEVNANDMPEAISKAALLTRLDEIKRLEGGGKVNDDNRR